VVELRRSGKTVISSTHLMDTAERLCDAVCIIAHEEKVLDGTLADVKAEHGGRYVALALANGAGDGVSPVLHDVTLVGRVNDANRTFEIELAPAARP
jgi:ABC-2 type transport system ATP-binding protein